MHQLRLATSWGELRVAGGSRAGEGSLLLLPQMRLALDAGRPSRSLVPMQHVVVSHGHLDHVLGLTAWASQRQLQGMPGGVALVPAGLADRVRQLLALAASMEGGAPYGVEVADVRPGDSLRLRPDFRLTFFRTSHWVETLGCRLEWCRRRLRTAYAGLGEERLQELRAAGVELTDEVRSPLLAYVADTGPEVFDAEPWLLGVEVLVSECTFLLPSDLERARRYGHMHIDDLAAVAPRLTCRHLVLTHLSRRHRLAEGSEVITASLAGRTTAAVHLLNVEWE